MRRTATAITIHSKPMVQDNPPQPQPQPQPRGGPYNRRYYGGDYFGQPGGREYGRETTETQVKIPHLQMLELIGVRVGIAVLATLSMGIFTPIFFLAVKEFVMIFILLVYCALGLLFCKYILRVHTWRIFKNVDGEVDRRTESAALALIAGAITGSVIYGAFVGIGLVIVPLWFCLLLVAFWFVGWAWFCKADPSYLTIWRYQAEIPDPHGPTPPRRATDRLTPIRPGEAEPVSGSVTLEDIEEILGRVVRSNVPRTEVPRPVVTNAGAPISQHPTPKPVPAGLSPSGPLPQGEQQIRGRGYSVSGRRVTSPKSKRTVLFDDLRFFNRRIGIDGTAFTKVWKEMHGWSLEHWRDVVDIFASIGLVSEREGGKETVILITNEDERLHRLIAWQNKIPLPPTPSAITNAENAGVNQTNGTRTNGQTVGEGGARIARK